MRLIAIFAIAILLCNISLAIGIAPGKTNMQFEPGRNGSVLIRVYNTENVEFTGEITVSGGLAPYVTVPIRNLDFSASDNVKNFTYLISLPQAFEVPGIHTADISVRELRDVPSGNIIISPTVGVITQLSVFVPYPAKYLDGVLMIHDIPIGEPLKVIITVTSKGNESIEEAYADISIVDNGVVLNRTTSVGIPVDKTDVIEAVFNTSGLRPGNYGVDALVSYDGGSFSLSGRFSILDLLVRILSVELSDYGLGQVLSMKVTLSNIANREIEDVRTGLRLVDDRGVLILDTSGLSLSIPALETGLTELFWDTRDIAAGIYLGNLTVSYEMDSYSRPIAVVLMDDGAVAVLDPNADNLMFWEDRLRAVPDKGLRLSLFLVLSSIVLAIGASYIWWRRKRD